jgi:radical SAM protein with 4Fe4S-binding SPASM domain
MIPRRNIVRAVRKAVAQPAYAVEAFKKRLKSSLTYKLCNGYSAYPETISLFLTYRCNLRCKMCGQWGQKGSSHAYPPEELRKQLSIDDIRKLLDDVAEFRPVITLFGGEPLIYEELPEVIRMIKERGMRCNVITNGVLLAKKAASIMDAGIDEIIFSLDGPRDIHDEIRGAAKTYDRAMAGFKKIAGLKKERNTSRPLVNISSTIFEVNYTRLDEIVRSAEEMSASSITFHHLIFLSSEIYSRHDGIFQNYFSCSSHDWEGFIREHTPDIIPEKLIQMLKKIGSLKTDVDVSVYPNLRDSEIIKYYTSFDFLPESYKNRCISPWMVAYVFPDGSVRPCQSLNYSIGNIRDASFKQLWNCDSASIFRKTLKKDKHFPVCTRCTEFYRY